MHAPNPIIKKECYISLAYPTTWIIYGSERKINHSTIFAIPGLSILFTSYIDPSGHSIGVDIVLALTSLRFNMAKKVQVVYGGQNFSDTKKKYFVTEQEALSVIEAIQKCRPYLMGNSFTVVVDHQLLKWLLSLRDPTWTLARGPLTLQGYDFSIQ